MRSPTGALLFALAVFLPGAFGSSVFGVVAFAVAFQLRGALKRAWRQSRVVVEAA